MLGRVRTSHNLRNISTCTPPRLLEDTPVGPRLTPQMRGDTTKQVNIGVHITSWQMQRQRRTRAAKDRHASVNGLSRKDTAGEKS